VAVVLYTFTHKQNTEYREQNTHNNKNKKNWEVWAVPRLCELYTGICLTTEEKARKPLSYGSRNYCCTRSDKNCGANFLKTLVTENKILKANSMEHSPSSGASRSLASHCMPRILQNTKVHFRVYKSPLLFPALGQVKIL
jgi:hypothetical protein